MNWRSRTPKRRGSSAALSQPDGRRRTLPAHRPGPIPAAPGWPAFPDRRSARCIPAPAVPSRVIISPQYRTPVNGTFSSAMPRTVGSAMWCRIHSVMVGSSMSLGRVHAHAAGVRPRVAFADSLVILRRNQRRHVLAVAEAQKAQFLALQKLLDHHLLLGRSQQFAAEQSPAPFPAQSAAIGQMITPLPAASPSAFTTIGGWKCLSDSSTSLALVQTA